MKAFSIRDLKSEGWSTPFFSMNRQTAMRELSVKFTENTMMASYSEDFALFEIGAFDENLGVLLGEVPHHVCEIADLISKEPDGQNTR